MHYFYDNSHFTDNGAEMIAKKISKDLENKASYNKCNLTDFKI